MRAVPRLAVLAAVTSIALATGVHGASGSAAAGRPFVTPARSDASTRVLPPPATTGPTAASLVGTARTAARRPMAAAAGFVVAGHGDGHGRGLGQYGAFGYASEPSYRWSEAQILAHYYQGAILEPAAPWIERGRIEVNLSELDRASVTEVRATRRGAAVRVNGGRRLQGARAIHHTGARRTIRATSGDVSVLLRGVGWRSYKGVIQIQPDGQTWNIVGVEDYVAGVVPAESPAGWGAVGGEAALQAQAVAARSYALAYVASVGYTCDISACQVYEGDPGTNRSLGASAAYTDQATSTTAGQVMCTAAVSRCRGADVAFTEFSASTGGWTSGGAFAAVVDQGDGVSANPVHDWTARLTAADVEAVFPGIGTPTALTVTARNGLGAWGGRALTVVVTGTSGSVRVTGDQFAVDFSLLSDWFSFPAPA